MNLSIGLTGSNKGWETILQQEGVSWQLLEPTDLKDVGENLSCLIVTANSEVTYETITQLISNGTAVVFEAIKFSELFKKRIRSKKIKAILPREDSFFKHLNILDIFDKIHFVDANSHNLLDNDLHIFSGILGKGNFYVIPFDLERLYLDHDFRRKRFPADRKELPSEIVSQVSKGELRRLIKLLLIEVYRQQDLPFLQKWYWNSNKESCFSFRVDTDYCSIEEAEKLHQVCRKNEISGTWFIDSADEERLKQVYTDLEGQEIAFHCERHRVFKSIEKNRYYINKGLDKLAAAGISVSGYAAPFGEWNEALAAVLEEKGFSYSSEFSLNYDDVPFYPFTEEQRYNVLQIPIHPISLGRLRRSHFRPEEMVKYFSNLIDQKIAEQEPVLIYHHPAHQHFNVIEEIFQYVRKKNLPVMNFRQWSTWWKYREQIDLKGQFLKNKLKLEAGEEVDFLVKITYRGRYCVIPFSRQIDLEKLDWKDLPDNKQRKIAANIRKWHWRDCLYNYESYKGKLRR